MEGPLAPAGKFNSTWQLREAEQISYASWKTRPLLPNSTYHPPLPPRLAQETSLDLLILSPQRGLQDPSHQASHHPISVSCSCPCSCAKPPQSVEFLPMQCSSVSFLPPSLPPQLCPHHQQSQPVPSLWSLPLPQRHRYLKAVFKLWLFPSFRIVILGLLQTRTLGPLKHLPCECNTHHPSFFQPSVSLMASPPHSQNLLLPGHPS